MKNKAPRILILRSTFNPQVTEGLEQGARARLLEAGIESVQTLTVPGAYELPIASRLAFKSDKYDAIVALGAVIKGETYHFEAISDAVSQGLMTVMLKEKRPIGFGVITTYTDAQAIERAQPNEHNKGREAADAVIKVLELGFSSK